MLTFLIDAQLSLVYLPLHSTVSPEEQMRVFVELGDKKQRKVMYMYMYICHVHVHALLYCV